MKKTLLSIIAIATINSGAIAQNVNIPDANFKAYLVGESAINTNGDSEIQVSEAVAFTGTIQTPGYSGIADLTGLEAFVNLTWIIIENEENLTSIDVSQNTNVTLMYIGYNNFNALDVSANLALETLLCYNNNLTSIDVSNNPNLMYFFCNDNAIESVDVSQNPNLAQLACANNNLTQLNVKNVSTSCWMNATGNPNLFCIEVDDVADATANWTNIDAGASFSIDCNYNIGINELNTESALIVYPNPTNSLITVDFNHSIEEMKLLDITGKIIMDIENTTNKIDLSALKNGIYNLQIRSNNQLFNKRIIKN